MFLALFEILNNYFTKVFKENSVSFSCSHTYLLMLNAQYFTLLWRDVVTTSRAFKIFYQLLYSNKPKGLTESAILKFYKLLVGSEVH